MDSYEATRIVFSRIQSFDPENASKIMGLLLIQDHGEKEMIRLAFGPEALVHSVILKARKDLGLPNSSINPPTSSSSAPSSPSVPYLSSNPITISRQNSSSSSSRLSLSLTIPNPSSAASFSDIQTPEELNNISPPNNISIPSSLSSSSSSSSSISMNSSSLPFYQNGLSGNDIIKDFQLQDQLSFLNEGSSPTAQYHHHLSSSSSPTNDAFPSYWPSSSVVHRRSCSVSDMCLASEDPNSPGFGLGWKPCLYFARGFCKNGTGCRFLHGGDQTAEMAVGSPNKIENSMMEQCHHELLRSKSSSAASHQQRLVSAATAQQQLMAASAGSFPYSPKCMNLLLQQQQNESQRAAAALMMGSEDLHKFGRSRLERNEFAMNGVNPASRQIYLTFPADSTFREEDVSNYFSIYGPVQDVRIPYQQKRMFGFVTFVYPETVKLILAKGNPHFVCDARVLVKPYKEKGKVQDKYRKQQQPQVERGDFSPCGTPNGLDSRDPFDLQLGARMFYNSQDMLWRRKLEEQAELQQALELQSRRLMGLQLLDVKKHHHPRALSVGSPIQSPTQSHNLFTQNLVLSSIQNSSEIQLENCSTPTLNPADQQAAAAKDSVAAAANNDENGIDKESPHDKVGDLLESLEHNLPDSPFASPTKAGGDYHHMGAFSGYVVPNEANNIDSDPSLAATTTTITTSSSMNLSTSLLPSSASTTLDMGSFKSFNCQIPRFSSSHGAIGMYAGTAGGPKCPVGI